MIAMAELGSLKVDVLVSATALRRSIAAELRRIADEIDNGAPADESARESSSGLCLRQAPDGPLPVIKTENW